MKHGELLKGIAVIIDDEIEIEDSIIYRIKNNIIDRNIPVATYREIPQIEVVESLSSAAFIILDWDFMSAERVADKSEGRLIPPAALGNQQSDELEELIKELLRKTFAPIFIFTGKAEDEVTARLDLFMLSGDGNKKRIFVKDKNDVDTGEKLFNVIDGWIDGMPSVYVLKAWEKIFNVEKNAMFNQLYSASPDWVHTVWQMLQEDSVDNQYEFGEFITRCLHNRTLHKYSFSEEYLDSKKTDTSNDNNKARGLQQIIETERYIKYEDANQPLQAYTGDLFKDGKDYYLNIRAQCAISRPKKCGVYNPVLYCIRGRKQSEGKIISEEISLNKDGLLKFDDKTLIDIKDIEEICNDQDKLEEFNKNFIQYGKKMIYRNGTILGRNDKVILGCVADKKILEFDMDIECKYFNDLKGKRIGRVLAPYITQIQQKCSQHIIREGTMPLPQKLFVSMENV